MAIKLTPEELAYDPKNASERAATLRKKLRSLPSHSPQAVKTNSIPEVAPRSTAKKLETSGPSPAPTALDIEKLAGDMTCSRSPTISQVRRVVCRNYRPEPNHRLLTEAEVCSSSQKSAYIKVREVIYLLARILVHYPHNNSYPEIGRRIGGRDHSTVIHGYKKAKKRLETDAEFRREVGRLISLIKEECGAAP